MKTPASRPPIDLRGWVDNELALLQDRVVTQVLGPVPPERHHEKVDGRPSITFLLWHSARHHDLAVNGALLDRVEVLASHDAIASSRPSAWAGLAEREDPAHTAELHPEAVADYYLAVLASTRLWLTEADLSVLDCEVDGRAALAAAGVPSGQFDWLHQMWSAQRGLFYLQWEAIGHSLNHLGEMVGVRNALGLSPF